MVKERLINPMQPIRWCLDRHWITEFREPQARPRPIDRMLNQSCSNWIAQDISDDGQQVTVLLDGKTFEPTLPDVAVAPIVLMVSAHMARHPPLHKPAETGFSRRLHHYMKVV